MSIDVRIEYRSTMGEVGRVLRAVQEHLGLRGVVWASDEDTIEGRSDSGFEPANGYAIVEVDVDDRTRAHELVVSALNEADPDHDVVVGGDVSMLPIHQH